MTGFGTCGLISKGMDSMKYEYGPVLVHSTMHPPHVNFGIYMSEVCCEKIHNPAISVKFAHVTLHRRYDLLRDLTQSGLNLQRDWGEEEANNP